MTIKDVTPNMIVTSKEGLTGRLTPYIDVGKTQHITFTAGQKITITEPPKNYENCGRCVKFKVNDNLAEMYCFWVEFKKYIY
jgi:hypothetical protein